ncbi:MAG: MFS transporter [Hyphomonadaceae bacterium]|nr:MAG: major facilitator transporter [Caulobacteraceae bacterium]MBT9446818.1 MFS transporter [Hyphomonadaceae bacterium]TPW03119.1 MAG: major facilitator transporter [Alphaproteobacteria bacterium]
MRLPDFSIFRHVAFARFWVTRATFVLGWQIQTTALLWHVHQLSLAAGRSEKEAVLALGLVGLFQFVPLFALSLIGGQLADRIDRKLILVVCYGVKLAIAVTLCIATSFLPPATMVNVIFGAAMVSGAVNAFQPAAAQALLPALVPREELPQAIALNSLAFTTSSIIGPSIGGVLLAFGVRDHSGAQLAFGAAAVLIAIGIAALLGVHVQKRVVTAARPTLELIKEGLGYVWNNKIVLGAISLDLVVVLLAGAQALVPVFADRILHADEAGFGMLRGALAIGAAVTAFAIAAYPLRRRVGRWMFGSTLVFALCTIVFGLSTSYWLSFAALAVAGAADMISVQVRQSLIQLATPEFMLGRVAAVSFVFISASNELGDFEAGLTGAIFGPALGVALGGGAAFLASVLWMWLFPQLTNADTFEDRAIEEAREAAPEEAEAKA